MGDDDLIRRGDALKVVSVYGTVVSQTAEIAALPALPAPVAELVDMLNEPVATHTDAEWIARRAAALAKIGDAAPTVGDVGASDGQAG
jgi:hypothetical protein